MLLKLSWCTLFIVLIKATVHSAPLDKTRDAEKYHRENLSGQLEDLQIPEKHEVNVLKTKSHIYSNVNGDIKEHSTLHEEVKQDGKIVGLSNKDVKTKQEPGARTPDTIVREDLAIPEKGIDEHHIIHNDEVVENDKRRSQQLNILYMTPTDISKYIYETGDESGVAVEIQNLVQQGMLNYDEALDLLQSIKSGLNYLNNVVQPQFSVGGSVRSYPAEEPLSIAPEKLTSSDDYDQLLDYLREREMAINTHSKYPVSDILFNLGKIIFSESMAKGDDEARKAMIKITDFLTNEVATGQMTTNEEKKTLDVLLASMIDTVESQNQTSDKKPKEALRSNSNVDSDRKMV